VPMTGGPEFVAALGKQILAAAAVTEIAVKAAAEVVQRKTVDNLMLQEHPRGTPTPSSPGEPPAMISGTLKASVTVTPVTVSGDGNFEARVGPTAVYARIQELGGTAGHGAQLPARPYLEPAVAEVKTEVHAVFEAHWAALATSL
jgi:phage gpG-like protein